MDKVIDTFAKKIVNHLVSNNYISREKEELYRYGVIVGVQSTITIITMLLIGLLFGRFFENICFMFILKFLRNFSGGLHSSNFSICYLISIASNIVVLLLLNIVELCGIYWPILMLEIMSLFIVAIFAPVINKNKPITLKESRLFKLLVILLSVVLLMVSVILIFIKSNVVFIIGITTALNGVLVLIEVIKNALSRNRDD